MTMTREDATAVAASHTGRRAMTIGTSVLLLAAALGLGTAVNAEGRAPTGPIEIVVGSSAGGTPDVVWRQAARILNGEGIIDNPIVVQNRTGGGWMVAANFVLERPGDANTMLAFAQPTLTTPISEGLPTVYDRLTGVAMITQADLVVVVRPDSPFETLSDLIEAAAAEPLAVSMVGAHAGGTAGLARGLIETAAGVEINYIPYDGGGAATAAFLGGIGDMMIVNPDEALPFVETDQARIISILNEERRTEPELADIPTAREEGIDVVWGQMWGLYGPPDLDPEVVAWWDEKLRIMVETEAWQEWLNEAFRRSNYVGPDRIDAHLEELHQVHLRALQSIGLAGN